MPVTVQNRRQRNAPTVVDRSAGSSVTTWINADQYREFESLAKELKTSKSALMQRLIQDHLALRRSLP